ncbi:MAG: DUF192 domain-containing protein [Bacillota bacterium]|nr:DUF192 domain-containing protein [Bacillota bacterium]
MIRRGGSVLARRVVHVRGFWGRLAGLIGRPCPAPGECWAFAPVRGVHTFFLAYPIAACLLDRGGRVLWVRDPMLPWRVSPVFGDAVWLLEAAPGRFCGLRPGDVLEIEGGVRGWFGRWPGRWW